MTLYGPNWNGVYWEQNTTKGTDSLAAIIDSASPTATKTFKWIFIVSGNRKNLKFCARKIGALGKPKFSKNAYFRRYDNLEKLFFRFFRRVDTFVESIFRGIDTIGEIILTESR